MDGQYTYWAAGTSGAILRTLTSGQGSPEIIASAVQPYALYVDATNAYFLDNNGLSSVPKGGGTVLPIPSGRGAPAQGPLFGEGSYVYTQVPSGGSDFLMQILPPNTVTTESEPPWTYWFSFFPAGDGLLFFNTGAIGGEPGTLGLFDPATSSNVLYAHELQTVLGNGALQSGVPASCGMVVSTFYVNEAWWVPLQIWNGFELLVPIMIPGTTDAGPNGNLLLVSDGTFLYAADRSNSSIYRTPLP
jgi:hypothetical protein